VSTQRPRRPSYSDRALAVAFMGFVTVPLIGTFFGWDLAEVDENRRPTAFPDLAATALDELPDQLDAYYRDHFGFRNVFIRRWNRLQRKLDKNLLRRVVRGRDPWLFEDRPEVMLDYLGRTETTVDDLEAWRHAIEERRDWLAERGVQYLFGVVPNKPTMYPQFLPEAIQAAARPTRRVQFLAHMAEHSDVPVLDVRPALVAKLDWKTLYLSNDTHWNTFGAFVGYQTVMRRLAELLPQVGPPLELSDCELVPGELYGNLAKYADLPEAEYTLPITMIRPPTLASFETTRIDLPVFSPDRVWPNDNRAPPIYRNPTGKGRAVIFHDSFFLTCVKLVAHHFEQTVPIWKEMTPDALMSVVEDQRPDVVIEILAERVLYKVPAAFEGASATGSTGTTDATGER